MGDRDPAETEEWLESVAALQHNDGDVRTRQVLERTLEYARALKVDIPDLVGTPYVNTIPPSMEAAFPGDAALEERVQAILRWNAMAMVQRANKSHDGIGGHISSYASSCLLYEIGLNHFFRGLDHAGGGDQIYVQGHCAPGLYARAFLEGRFSGAKLDNFRQETGGKGLSSYPHPWLMPDFWQFPTVSMGLGPLAAIYQARFNRYLHNRGLKDTNESRVWCFIGDGECDEPETLGALTLAAREGLNNLVFVANCNLQRLDGPVRGNGKIIQELEGVFRGAGWRVIKVIWGPEWDDLLARDQNGALVSRLGEVVDGQFQKYTVEDGAYMRQDLFGANPELTSLVQHLTDDDLKRMRRGGHSHEKVYAAYHEATRDQSQPTVLLMKTVKGWGLGTGFAGSNTTHQQKKMKDDGLLELRDFLSIPLNDKDALNAKLYHPGKKSEEVEYMLERRQALGGPLPARKARKMSVKAPATELYGEFSQGSKAGVEVSSTMAFVRLLKKLIKDKEFGKYVVPIIPDEGRTFGMESMFREIGIYAPFGQKYEPVDAKMFLNYHESQKGQLLQEGITEAGSMASFTAAGTSYATHNVPTIPFYIFYSMFGLQRTGDQAWAFGDARGRGFLLGATAGRTTLNGEGLQHEDGHSHLLANTYPTMRAYDPAFAYEVAVIIRDGLRRMIDDDEDVFYYLTLYNENHLMPEMPKGVEDGIVRGMYRYAAGPAKMKLRAQLFGSGTMLPSVIKAQEVLAERYSVSADVWSVTSYQQLFRDGRACERENRLRPTARKKQVPYITQCLEGAKGPIVATSDWVEELPSLVARFIPNRFVPLGANGFGRSDTREALRSHFEIDTAHVVYSTLVGLFEDGKIQSRTLNKAQKELGIDPDKVDSMVA